jgi:hypothetical protein
MKLKAKLASLTKEERQEIIEKIAASPDGVYQGVSVLDLLPFVEKKDIDVLMLASYQNGTSPMRCYPFATVAGRSLLLKRVLEANDEAFELKPLLPFLTQEDLQAISDKIHANQGHFSLLTPESLVPFLSKK